MKRVLLVFLGLVSSIGLVSCNDIVVSSTENFNTYTITWLNDNGDVLEIDNDVREGEMPSYDGDIPTKSGDDVIYVFDGWSPSISEVTEDATYTATYKSYTGDELDGVIPQLSSDGKSVEYGLYPQSCVNDSSLIAKLDVLEPTVNNWYYYEGNYYFKDKASTFNGLGYLFNDKVPIVNEKEYWFKCEVITWDVVKVNDGIYTLVSNIIIDAKVYYKDYEARVIEGNTILPNNYQYSDIREFLNNEFYNNIFILNNHYVKESLIGNNEDKVYLLSEEEYALYTAPERKCYATDYVRSRGIWCNEEFNYTTTYWTRSASKEFDYSAININSNGYISDYVVDGRHGVRPSVSITIA